MLYRFGRASLQHAALLQKNQILGIFPKNWTRALSLGSFLADKSTHCPQITLPKELKSVFLEGNQQEIGDFNAISLSSEQKIVETSQKITELSKKYSEIADFREFFRKNRQKMTYLSGLCDLSVDFFDQTEDKERTRQIFSINSTLNQVLLSAIMLNNGYSRIQGGMEFAIPTM